MSWVKFSSGMVGQALWDRDGTWPPSTALKRTRLGTIAVRDLQRYYAALEDEQRRVPISGADLRLICRALPVPIYNPATWIDLRVFWQRVEHVAHEDEAAHAGVDVEHLVRTLREAP